MGPYTMPHRQINSKLIKDLNLRPQTVKLLDKNIGYKVLDIGLSDFLDLTPKAKSTKAKISGITK